MIEARTEASQLQRAVERYRSAGYRVILEPSAKLMPPSLQGYVPDFLAVRGDEHVAVEVKARAAVATIDSLRHVAETLARVPGWRLDLVVGGPEGSATKAPLDVAGIRARLASADFLAFSHRDYSSAMLLLWTAVEAALRHILSDHGETPTPLGPRLAKIALSDGLLTDRDFAALERLADVRNQVVHGSLTRAHATLRSYRSARRVIERLVQKVERRTERGP